MSLLTGHLTTSQLEDLAEQDAKEARSFYRHWFGGIGVAFGSVALAVVIVAALTIKFVF